MGFTEILTLLGGTKGIESLLNLMVQTHKDSCASTLRTVLIIMDLADTEGMVEAKALIKALTSNNSSNDDKQLSIDF